MKKLILFAIVLIGFAANSFAQSTATASASAIIIGPIGISKSVDLAFGNIAVGATGGTVVLTPAATATRSATGGVTLPVVTGTVTAAKFTVTGDGSRTYSITLPSTDVNLTSGSNTMKLNAFSSTPSGTGTLASGTQDVYVGGTLNVGASQATGTYSGTFDVTVNYN